MIINRVLGILLIWIANLSAVAHNKEGIVRIGPLTSTTVNVWRTDIYAYGAWTGYKNANLWTANNNTGKHHTEHYLNFIDIGFGVNLYKDRGFIFEGNIAYTHGELSYSRQLFPKTYVGSHWLTLDSNISHLFLLDGMFYGGIKSSVFMSSMTKNNDNFSIEGIYSDCFNLLTFFPYFGMRLRFQYIKLEARIGGQVVPYLNTNKIAYHNMHKTYVKGLYFEARLGVKLFSTSNPSRPVNKLFINY